MRDLPRTTVLLWAAVAVAAVVLGGRELMHDAGPRAGATSAGGSAASRASGGSVIAAPRAGSGRVVVDVAGAVRRPGVYRLAAGARVQQALRRAGGATASAQLALVNRAAKVVDGQQIVVPARPGAAGPGTTAASGAPDQPISLNSATAEQLDQLDGVGPATADKITAWRNANGGFHSVDDLAQVPGIGPKRLEALRPHLTP